MDYEYLGRYYAFPHGMQVPDSQLAFGSVVNPALTI